MTRLRLRLPTPGDWERFFDASSAPGGVFCPTSTPPVVGTPVHLEITFVRGPRVFVRGIVTWRRTQSKDVRTRAGAGVQVHPVEHSKLTYITGWAMGHSLDQRQLRRLPIRLRVTYSGKSARRINFTRDLNEHSLFIHSSDPLAPNTVVKLQLHPPGTLPPFELKGRVTRCVHEVEQQGMGVRLDFTDSPLQTSYEKFIKQLEEQFLIGKLPDDAIS